MARKRIQTAKYDRQQKADQINSYMDMLKDLGQAVSKNEKLNNLK